MPDRSAPTTSPPTSRPRSPSGRATRRRPASSRSEGRAMSDALEPIVDAHHHIWRLDDLPWLKGPPVPRIFGDYAALRRDYLVDEYLAEARAAGVVQSVYVQVNVAPRAEVAEAAWV